MPLTTAGQEYIATKIFDGTGTLFDNSNAYIGVGDSTTAFAIGQTDLQAASNKLRVGMDATFPTLTGTPLVDLTLQSTFSTAQANYAWEEWAVFNASTAGTMLCRKVENLGTKTSAQTWEITVVISILIGA
jgi:hypothetical protein